MGGTLPDILGYEKAKELIDRSDSVYLKFGADTNVYGVGKEKEIREIRAKAIGANLKLVECPIRHIGTEKGYEIYQKLQKHLKDVGVDMRFDDPVRQILIEDGIVGVDILLLGLMKSGLTGQISPHEALSGKSDQEREGK